MFFLTYSLCCVIYQRVVPSCAVCWVLYVVNHLCYVAFVVCVLYCVFCVCDAVCSRCADFLVLFVCYFKLCEICVPSIFYVGCLNSVWLVRVLCIECVVCAILSNVLYA